MNTYSGTFIAVALILGAMIFAQPAGATRVLDSALGYQVETFSSAFELKITPKGILPIKATQSAEGDSQVSPVTLSPSNDEAHTVLTKGNWGYQAMISVIDGITPADTTYKVEFERDGTPVGTLYIKSGIAPRAGDHLKVTFDLGTSSLNPDESFLVTVMAV